jgi:hypothetical protein
VRGTAGDRLPISINMKGIPVHIAAAFKFLVRRKGGKAMTSLCGVLCNRTAGTIALIELLVLTGGVSIPCLPQENPDLNTYFRTHIGLSDMQIQAVMQRKGVCKNASFPR